MHDPLLQVSDYWDAIAYGDLDTDPQLILDRLYVNPWTSRWTEVYAGQSPNSGHWLVI